MYKKVPTFLMLKLVELVSNYVTNYFVEYLVDFESVFTNCSEVEKYTNAAVSTSDLVMNLPMSWLNMDCCSDKTAKYRDSYQVQKVNHTFILSHFI